MTRFRSRLVAVVAATALAAVACGGDDDDNEATSPSTTSASAQGITAQVAGYDFAASGPQRVIVGLIGREGRLVSFGTARFSFAFLGEEKATGAPQPGPTVEATWIPIPGQQIQAGPSAPREVEPSEGAGVYEARDVTFDRPGLWQVTVTVDVGGKSERATAAFPVAAEHRIVNAGDDAPRSENHRPGAPGVPPGAVDSRADSATVPDPELHAMTVAEALATGRPTTVVVSTPVYCVSRFCGPITDAVGELAKRYGDRMGFVHLEVWRDFEKRQVNKAAAEWIYPDNKGGANEPWVFLVGTDGKVIRRWDNVADTASLERAIQETTG